MSANKTKTATAKAAKKPTDKKVKNSTPLTVNDSGVIEEATVIHETANEPVFITGDAAAAVRAQRITEPQPHEMTAVNITPEEHLPTFTEVHDPAGIMGSKKYVKGAFSFQSPAELLQPCIEAMAATKGKLTLSGTHEATNANSDLTKNISYGRLNLVSRYEIDSEMFYEIGILAAYDLQAPKLKIYRGAKVAACTNLCIFQAEDIVKFDIAEGINMEQVQSFLKSITAKVQESVQIANRLKQIQIPEKLMSEIMGKMLMNTVEKETFNGTTSILRATELFTDSKSKYYYKQPGFNGWQLFNAFTEHYAAKVNFFDIPEKTRDTYQLLKDICLS